MQAYRLVGSKVGLRPLCVEDAQGDYFQWLQQPDVVAALSSQRYPISRQGLADYIRANLDRDGVALFGICDLADGRLVGTVRLAVYDAVSRVAGIGIMVGDPRARGQGFARQALSIAIEYGFKTLNFQKIMAGVASGNAASLALFRSVMTEEGVRRRHFYADGCYQDEYMFAAFTDVP